MSISRVGMPLLAVLLAGSAGCGQSTTATPVQSGARAAAGLRLEVQDATYALGGSAGSIALVVSSDTPTHLVVDIAATDAAALKALYFKLRYDPALLCPAIVEPGAAMGGRSELLSLSYPAAAGELDYGQVQTHPDYRTGFSGDGVLAQVSLRKAPAPQRAASAAARPVAVQLSDLAFAGSGGLGWSYASRGDYDQNGEVNLADLTPLSQHFREVSPQGVGEPFPFASALSQLDGDGNGEINAADITTIAQSFGVSALGGFRVFRSADPADFPNPPTGPNGLGTQEVTTAPLPVADAVNGAARGAERLRYSCSLGGPVSSDYYWVRAYDAIGNAGVATSVKLDAVDFAFNLAPATPASTGSGTPADPYAFDSGTEYSFMLHDDAGNDVSLDPATQFAVDPGAAGGFAGNTLSVASGFSGDFTVSATYNNIPLEQGDGLHCHVAASSPAGTVIFPDPIDPDWAGVTGTGTDETNKFILRTDAFNSDYSLFFTLRAESKGVPVPNDSLEWDAFPPFTVADPLAFNAPATAGTFQTWEFTAGYLFAQDAALNTSNLLYVAVNSLPH